MSKRIPLEGKIIGKLTVFEYIGGGKYRCQCDCGNVVEVFGSNLTRGHTTSCGCAKLTADLTGKQFGRLTVIKRVPPENGRTCWECRCECGNTVNVRSDCLTSGATQSCGCLTHDKDMPEVIKADFVGGTQVSKIQGKPTKANKSGVVGVNWDKSRNKWQASIRFHGHKYNLGRFTNFEDAVEARRAAEKEIFDDFLRWYNAHYGK